MTLVHELGSDQRKSHFCCCTAAAACSRLRKRGTALLGRACVCCGHAVRVKVLEQSSPAVWGRLFSCA